MWFRPNQSGTDSSTATATPGPTTADRSDRFSVSNIKNRIKRRKSAAVKNGSSSGGGGSAGSSLDKQVSSDVTDDSFEKPDDAVTTMYGIASVVATGLVPIPPPFPTSLTSSVIREEEIQLKNAVIKNDKEKERLLLSDRKFKNNRIMKSSSKGKLSESSDKGKSDKRKISAPPKLETKTTTNAATIKSNRSHSNLNLNALIKSKLMSKRLNNEDIVRIRRKSVSSDSNAKNKRNASNKTDEFQSCDDADIDDDNDNENKNGKSGQHETRLPPIPPPQPPKAPPQQSIIEMTTNKLSSKFREHHRNKKKKLQKRKSSNKLSINDCANILNDGNLIFPHIMYFI